MEVLLRWLLRFSVAVAVVMVLLPSVGMANPYTSDPNAIDVREAKRLFKKAIGLVEEGNFEAAVVQFEASYELVPRPNTLYNLGLVHEKLFRYDRALEYYEEYLKIAEEDDPDREVVLATIERLQGLLGTVDVQVSPKAQVWLDDRLLGEAPQSFSIPAGRHILELHRDGYGTVRRQVQVVAGRSVTIDAKLVKTEAEATGISPLFFWTGLGLTVVTAGIGSYFGLRTLSLRSDAEELNGAIEAEANEQAAIADDMEQSALMADIFFVSAGVLAAGTLVALLITNWDADEKSQEQEPATRVSGFALPTGAGLVVQGEF